MKKNYFLTFLGIIQKQKNINIRFLFICVFLYSFIQSFSQGGWVKKNNLPTDITFTAWANYTLHTTCSSATKGYNFLDNTLMEYDPATDAWTKKTDFPEANALYESSCFAIGSKVYVGLGRIFPEFWEYDLTSNVWTRKADFPGLSGRYTTAFTIGSKGYICGGIQASTCETWEYDPILDNWTKKADLPDGIKFDCEEFTIGDKAYIVGGLTNDVYNDYNYIISNQLWEYDNTLNVWTQKANYPGQQRINSIAFSINNRGYFGLGYDYLSTEENYQKEIWEYNPTIDQWNLFSEYPGGGHLSLMAFSINNKAYIGGGGGNYIDTVGDWLGEWKDFWTFSNVTVNPQLSVGSSHSLLIKSDGSLWAWGANYSGRLGDGTTVNKSFPVQIGNLAEWKQVSAGISHSMAIKTDGTLWAWGNNDYGQLGNGTTNQQLSPVQIGNQTTWKQVSGGEYYSLAIKTDGTLWVWGNNEAGQLGVGSTTEYHIPVQLSNGTNWKSVEAGEYFSLAIKADGSLWGWGANMNGQLGIGITSMAEVSPIRIGTDSNWKEVSIGFTHTLAIKTDGTLWAWGNNDVGKLGDGTFVSRLSPVKIGTDTTWSHVSAGNVHSMAMKNDGTLWTWGSDYNGDLGNGSDGSKSIPTQISGITNGVQVGAGFATSIILKSDNQYCGAGYNTSGQLGDGTNTNKISFNCLAFPATLKSTKVNSNVPESMKVNQSKSALLQNYPNPTQGATNIDYYLADDATSAKIVFYNYTGSIVKEYLIFGKGKSSIDINIENLPSGMYSYALFVNGSKIDIRKLLLTK